MGTIIKPYFQTVGRQKNILILGCTLCMCMNGWIIEKIYNNLNLYTLSIIYNGLPSHLAIEIFGHVTEVAWEKNAYMSKNVCSLVSKLWSVICSQNSPNSALVMEEDVIPLRRAKASNSSPANWLDSFIPINNYTSTHQL